MFNRSMLYNNHFMIKNLIMFAMNSYRTLSFLWILSSLTKASVTSASKWYRDASFDNKMSHSAYGLTSRGLIHCADACAANNTCKSFFFVRRQLENCMILSMVLLHGQISGLWDLQGSAYYIFENGTTTPASPGTDPPFSCPSDDATFRTVTLSDNSTFTYRVFKTYVNQTQARANCISENGFLARVTTVAKMNALLVLANCTEYASHEYYVDGSNIQSVNTWIMSNNEPVPMSNDFWGPGKPDTPSEPQCLRMSIEVAHKWNDMTCDALYYYICEK